MSELLISRDYIFVIDTDHDAEDFAGALVGYSTGLVGEADGIDAVDCYHKFYEELGIEDDEGKGRLASEKSPLHGLIVDQEDNNYNWSPYAVWPSRAWGVDEEDNYARLTEENCERHNYPAGFSVGIFMQAQPTDEEKALIKGRAEKFFKEVCKVKGVRIEGFRLIVQRRTAEEMNV